MVIDMCNILTYCLLWHWAEFDPKDERSKRSKKEKWSAKILWESREIPSELQNRWRIRVIRCAWPLERPDRKSCKFFQTPNLVCFINPYCPRVSLVSLSIPLAPLPREDKKVCVSGQKFPKVVNHVKTNHAPSVCGFDYTTQENQFYTWGGRYSYHYYLWLLRKFSQTLLHSPAHWPITSPCWLFHP